MFHDLKKVIPWEKITKSSHLEEKKRGKKKKKQTIILSSLANNWKLEVYLPGEGRKKFPKLIIKNKMRTRSSA